MNMRLDDFNPTVVKELLLSITVSPEVGELLGVSSVILEQWIRELAERLGDECSVADSTQAPVAVRVPVPGKESWRLSECEIHFLMDGFDALHA